MVCTPITTDRGSLQETYVPEGKQRAYRGADENKTDASTTHPRAKKFKYVHLTIAAERAQRLKSVLEAFAQRSATRYRFFLILMLCFLNLPCKFNKMSQVKTTSEGNKAQALFNKKINMKKKLTTECLIIIFTAGRLGLVEFLLNCLKIQ